MISTLTNPRFFKTHAGFDWFRLIRVLPLFFPICAPCLAQSDYEEPPINYNTAEVHDPIAVLQRRIDAGEADLSFDREHGYLKSVLELLDVPSSSQALVYSKTSFQLRLISPQTPRAIYFGDDVYIGWCQGGTVLEVSSVDPQQGAIFYSLKQTETKDPAFVRHTYECTQCHGSTLTQGVPGHTVRSVFTASDGYPILSAGTYRTNQESPLTERWGGWYVSGTHGKQRHMGNVIVRSTDDPENLNLDKGANVTDLRDYFYTRPYLRPTSDIVALMVLEHQTQMHNLITRGNYEGRLTLRDAKVMNEMLGRPNGFESESTQRRFKSSAERIVKYMLFTDEAELTDSIEGTSGFSADFESRGPTDHLGRSLRQFDLQTRLFKYPCSYLIYSEAFDALPIPVKEQVYQKLWEVLTADEAEEDFEHLTAEDRTAILEILRETKEGLPDYWQG